LSRRAAFEAPNNGVERARLTVGDLASLGVRAAHAERYAAFHRAAFLAAMAAIGHER
jgi:hypothetical protein